MAVALAFMKKKLTRAYKIYFAVGLVFVALVLGATFFLFSHVLGALGPALGG